MSLAEEVSAWLDANWDESVTVREWWSRLARAGYAHPTWPRELGGFGGTGADARVVTAALARRGVIGPPIGHVATRLAAPTILEHGSASQIAELVGPIALGEAAWCQLFSEPGSGSDLASLGARAVLDGDEWIVNGQKVWNSGADSADFGMLLARTDIDQPKHRGISYLIIDMHQPGVEVRPLKVMNGMSPFCEVFLTDARVRADRVLGAVGDGWRVAQSTLSYERGGVAGSGTPGLLAARSGTRGDLDTTVGAVMDRARRAAAGPAGRTHLRGGAIPSKAMIDLAQEYGVAGDAVLRQELARYVSTVRVNAWTLRRIGAAGGRLTGADGSITKITTARICQDSGDLGYRIVGASGMLSGPASPLDGELQAVALASPGTRIGGGTDEIQLNVLGERALGLPREPGDDRDVPYRELRVGTQR